MQKTLKFEDFGILPYTEIKDRKTETKPKDWPLCDWCSFPSFDPKNIDMAFFFSPEGAEYKKRIKKTVRELAASGVTVPVHNNFILALYWLGVMDGPIFAIPGGDKLTRAEEKEICIREIEANKDDNTMHGCHLLFVGMTPSWRYPGQTRITSGVFCMPWGYPLGYVCDPYNYDRRILRKMIREADKGPTLGDFDLMLGEALRKCI